MADLGSDFSCIDDIDENLSTVAGETALVQSLIRRLNIRRGSMPWDPNYGLGISKWLDSHSTPTTTMRREIESECYKEERVQSVSVSVINGADSIQIDVRGATANGPFEFTTSVGSLTAESLATQMDFSKP